MNQLIEAFRRRTVRDLTGVLALLGFMLITAQAQTGDKAKAAEKSPAVVQSPVLEKSPVSEQTPAAERTVPAGQVITERVTLNKPEDYPSVWYDHGCPNCGLVIVGEITRKLNHRVARIDKVSWISQSGNAIWYRCGVQTDTCGTKTEFTADFNAKSGPCEGKTSCYVWRFATDAKSAADVIEVSYLPRR